MSGELKLELACGTFKTPGFIGVDVVAAPAVDQIVDLTRTPWPWADGSVSDVRCAHFFEHLDGEQRIAFMHELYRVLKPGGRALIIVPHARSDGAIADPTHRWPPLIETSFNYYNAEARRDMGVAHYGIRCDFDFEVDMALTPEWQHRAPQEQMSALRHFWNVASELHVHLTRR